MIVNAASADRKPERVELFDNSQLNSDHGWLGQIVDGGKEQLVGEIKGKHSEPATIQGIANSKCLMLLIRARVSGKDEVFSIDHLKVTLR